MKKYIILFTALLLLVGQYSFAQSKSVDAMYQKYKGNENFIHLDIGGSFMNFARGFNIQLDHGKQEAIANSMERLKMYKLPVNSETAKKEYNELKKGLEKENFDLTLEMQEKKNGIQVYTKGNKIISDIVVLVRDDKNELIVLELLGKFEAEALTDIGNITK
ncbi:DUF4252 domain-containing protein [Indibacter alkaliphilus]|nr:DUF4252 domain-containing protein [Indibacter alkaliphilus]